MTVRTFEIEGPLLFEPPVRRDDRGWFRETWHAERYREAGLPPFVQDNVSCSRRGVLRGLHFQAAPHAQGKLVSVVAGAVWDVAVDLRADRDTFGRWVAATLSSDYGEQLWVPPGFAHGFVALAEGTVLAYKCSHPYVPEADRAVRWDDPDLGIAWPVRRPFLSPKDRAAPGLQELEWSRDMEQDRSLREPVGVGESPGGDSLVGEAPAESGGLVETGGALPTDGLLTDRVLNGGPAGVPFE